MRFVFLHFLNGAPVLLQVLHRSKTLDFLGGQVPVRHGVSDGHHPQSFLHEQFDDPAGGLAFAATGPYGAYRDYRFCTGDHGIPGTQQCKIGPGGIYHGAYRHYLFIVKVAVGKNAGLYFQLPDQFTQLFLSINGNSFWIEFSRKFGRVSPSVYVRDLGCGEGHHLVFFVIPEIGVEIVKVPAGCADDKRILSVHLE